MSSVCALSEMCVTISSCSVGRGKLPQNDLLDTLLRRTLGLVTAALSCKLQVSQDCPGSLTRLLAHAILSQKRPENFQKF